MSTLHQVIFRFILQDINLSVGRFVTIFSQYNTPILHPGKELSKLFLFSPQICRVGNIKTAELAQTIAAVKELMSFSLLFWAQID
jgi:hypothetical protein